MCDIRVLEGRTLDGLTRTPHIQIKFSHDFSILQANTGRTSIGLKPSQFIHLSYQQVLYSLAADSIINISSLQKGAKNRFSCDGRFFYEGIVVLYFSVLLH
jgi:hypothetical protein